MSYRLLIVDDEEDIREGLADLVDWTSLGYAVAARLEDGRDAISFIESNPVDVILTDIKMTFVSGLELAKYVYDRQFDIKMILISGYKEFEFAQQAVNYKVMHYLLKPTRLDEITRVFKDVKLLLDKEKAEKEQALSIQSRNEEMLSVLRRQFFADLMAGTLKERAEIDRRLRLIGLPIDPESCPCCSYYIRFPRKDPDSGGNPGNADGQLFRFIHQIFLKEQEGILTFPISAEPDKILLAAIDLRADGLPEKTLRERVGLQFETVKSRINAVLGIDAALSELSLYSSITEIISLYAIGEGPRSETEYGDDDRTDTLVIQKAKTYMQSMYDKEISLEDVAEHVYLSPVYFSRLFKKQTGRNFTDYLTEVRMMKAMEYLRQPQYKVYEIGSIIGYKSTKYFFKLFKQYAGCTPSEYRNKLHDPTVR